MWRTISLVVTGFWLVMSSLLVRYVWFPEGSHFSDVPPPVVLRGFLEQSSSLATASSLWVFRHDEKIGFANVRCSRLTSGRQDYMLRIDGFLDRGALPFADEKAVWRLSLKLLQVEKLSELKGNLRVERTPWVLDFHWQQGQKAPEVNLQAPEDSPVNNPMLQLMLAQAFSGGAAPGLLGGVATDPGDVLRVRARESEMDFAGQKSHGHLLEFTVMDRWKARAFITEAGEFVLMDLPEGYRLVDPVIQGLAPDYDAEDEEEAAAVGTGNAKDGK